MLQNAKLHGGPCDGRTITLQFDGPPPLGIVCKGVGYLLLPNMGGRLEYGTQEYLASLDNVSAARLARDPSQAWKKVVRAMSVTGVRERHRIQRARQRIKRAVR